MSSKKSSNNDLAAQIKNDMVNYIGPIFQELKTDIGNVESRLSHKIKEETHRLGILMEQMDKKIDTALEASSSVLKHEDIVKDHEDRIEHLEGDVRVLKNCKIAKALIMAVKALEKTANLIYRYIDLKICAIASSDDKGMLLFYSSVTLACLLEKAFQFYKIKFWNLWWRCSKTIMIPSHSRIL